MNNKTGLPVDDLIRSARTAKLEDDPQVQGLILSAAVTGDADLVEALSQGLNLKAAYEQLRNIPYKPPTRPEPDPELLRGRYLWLGIVMDEDYPYVMPVDPLASHLALIGGSGTGKTNLLYGISLQAMRKGIPVWFFDRDKQDYRHLKRFQPDLIILDVIEALPRNFLEPPTGVKPKHWIAVLVQVFCKSNSLLDGSESLLLREVTELYEDYGVFAGGKDYPTGRDLYHKIKNLCFSKQEYRFAAFQSSILNRLEALIALHGEMFDYSRGVPVEELAKRSIVFEAKGLTERMARFVLNMQLYSLFMHRIAVGERGNTLRNLVVIDEAKWLAPPGYNDKLAFSPLTYVLSQAREVGMGLILADQTAELDEAVFVNSLTKVCFRLGSGKDIRKIRDAFSLTQAQAEFINRLETGQCIVRVPSEDPFLLQTLRVNFE